MKLLNELRCGKCGENKHILYRNTKTGDIMTSCFKCNTISQITHTSELTIEWGGEEEEGVLCGGWD